MLLNCIVFGWIGCLVFFVLGLWFLVFEVSSIVFRSAIEQRTKTQVLFLILHFPQHDVLQECMVGGEARDA
jgi:hypothetical protein